MFFQRQPRRGVNSHIHNFFQNLQEVLLKEFPFKRLSFDKVDRVIFYKLLEDLQLYDKRTPARAHPCKF